MTSQQFSQVFCREFSCSPFEYEDRAFDQCLYWHAKFIAPVLRRLNPGFFEDDLKLIRDLGAVTDWREAQEELLNFRHANSRQRSTLRMILKIRVSGRKAGRLVRDLLAQEAEAEVGAN